MFHANFLNKKQERGDFTVKCDKCGHEAYIYTTRFYGVTDEVNPHQITLTFKCKCGNEFVALVHQRKSETK